MTSKMKMLKNKPVMVGLCAVLGLIAALLAGQFYLAKDERGLFASLSESDFSLLTHEGKAISNEDLIGKPTAIYFGFTWCPDICPTTLSLMADIKADLVAQNTPDAAELQLVFFSVDPQRDTVQQMAEYLTLFDADILGITGDEDAIRKATKRFGIFAERVEMEDDDYLIDHSSSVYLYNRKGQFKGTISPAEPYEMASAKMVRLVTR